MFLAAERASTIQPARMNTNIFLASLVWGAIGSGFVIYGKKQREMVPLYGGIAVVATSYFAESALVMSVICTGLLVATYFFRHSLD